MMISPGSPEQVVVAFLMGLIDLVSYTKFSPFPGPSLAILEPPPRPRPRPPPPPHTQCTQTLLLCLSMQTRSTICFRRSVSFRSCSSFSRSAVSSQAHPHTCVLCFRSCVLLPPLLPPARVADQAFAIKVDLSRFESSSAQTLDLLLCVMVLTPIVFGVFTAIGVATIPILEAC